MNIDTTDKVKSLILRGITKVELAQKLDIERITLDRRLERHNWKRPEIELINRM